MKVIKRKAVTEVKNKVKDKEQVRDTTMSDHFKTLIEQQRKKQMKNRIQ